MKVIIGHDQDVDSPFEDCEWEFHSFSRRHRHFTDPAELGLSYQTIAGRPVVISPGLRRKLQCKTAFFCWYYEHGLCRWGITGSDVPCGVEFRWDGVRHAGLLLYKGNPKYLPRHRRLGFALSLMQEYTDWCNGEVYYYSIVNDKGKWIDSCGGFYGTDTLCEAIAESLGSDEFELEEEWKHLRPDIEKERKNGLSGICV